MQLAVNAQWLIAFLLAFTRGLAWLLVVPPFNDRKVIPRLATLAAAAGLGLLVAPTLGPSSLPHDTAGLLGDLVVQVLTGAALGFVVSLLLSAVTAAGGMLDLLGGLTLPPSIDPMSADQTPMLGQLYEQMAILLLFVSNGYLLMVRGFVTSFRVPSFTLGATHRMAAVLTVDFGTYFASALEMAGPILVVLFAAQIVLGLLSKAAPQANVWILGFPLQIFLALTLAAIGLSVLPSYVSHLLTRALGDGAALFGR